MLHRYDPYKFAMRIRNTDEEVLNIGTELCGDTETSQDRTLQPGMVMAMFDIPDDWLEMPEKA